MKRAMLQRLLSPQHMIRRVAAVHTTILEEIEKSHAKAFRRRWVDVGSGPRKLMTRIDEVAQDSFEESLDEFNNEVILWGEESLNSLTNLEGEERPCILVDIIDGTDLLERGFSNWCSAIVIFTKNTIEGAFVAIHLGFKNVMYYGLSGDTVAHKIEYTQRTDGRVHCSKAQKLSVSGENRLLEHASVCSYGQKSGNLLQLLRLNNKRSFIQLLNANIERQAYIKTHNIAEEVQFRFYNLAGNPMMVKLADGIIDVVFDLKGQQPHDVVPGAFIAMMAGAVLWDIELGEYVSASSFVTKLLRPGSLSMKYVLAANKALLDRAVEILCLVEKWDGVAERRTVGFDRRARPPQIPTPPPPSPSH